MKPNFTIFTNGFEGTWPAIEYGAWIAGKINTHLTLIGVVEQNDSEHPVEEIFSRAVTLFQENNLDYSLELDSGPAEKTIVRTSNATPDHLLVFGPFGRPQFRKMVVGNSFRYLMETVDAPILYVRTARLPVKRVLISIGGLGYKITTENLGLRMAQMTGASVTLMTVVPPIDIDYPEARKIRNNWKNLADTDTLIGRKLREGLESAREAGVEAKIKIRHGKIVEELLGELKNEPYELICMGSQFSAHGLRQYYTPNITADVAETDLCPILTARFFESNP